MDGMIPSCSITDVVTENAEARYRNLSFCFDGPCDTGSEVSIDEYDNGDQTSNALTFIEPDHTSVKAHNDQATHSQGDQTSNTLTFIEPDHTYMKAHNGKATQGYVDIGDPTFKCQRCGALMWFNEKVGSNKYARNPSFSMCCLKGKVQLPPLAPPPDQFVRLFFDEKTPSSRNFLTNIRTYNNMFSFTSMGGKIDYSKNSGGGPYSFVLSGINYHRIGSLLPPKGSKLVYSQLYIYDTDNEVCNRISTVSKHMKESAIDNNIVDHIKKTLDDANPFVKQYGAVSSMIKNDQNTDVKICLISTRTKDGRNYNLPSTSKVVALIVGDIDMNFGRRDVIVHKLSGLLQRIDELHPSYLSLQYPILFPRGEDGYCDNIEHREETLSNTKKKKRVSIREYFAYRLMMRENEMSTILHTEKLFQQFIVDGYTMIEAQRLLWVRTHQKELRVDLYQGLIDALLTGERSASSTGKRIILPSSFTGGARYMVGNYKDAMAICR
ncbi:uncharacterized protein LOC114756253 [Neltuma alba]|uniref:uncharacterized protein LOC114756253 n=1 Tax=Neltuma alba TaxID=207710 RepID=UPI0010A519C4|nr:uncharacterized protein LOC114756253 [Prosopis alba]